MITRQIRIQLAIFVVGTLLALAYVGTQYVRIDRFFGGTYAVTVKMPESGGIFTGADVTYRGVSVGRVSDMWLDGDGVNVQVRIDPKAPPIPADTTVVVANRSAVGEQFLDFQPATSSGPFLADDSVIAADRTRVPVDTETLLTNVTALLGSVNPDDLNTVVTELGTAVEGSGDDLRTLIASSNSFLVRADQKYDVTAALIDSAGPVLQTQVDTQDDIRAFARNLRSLTTAVRSSDPDLRRTIDAGGTTAATLRAVLDENSDDVAALLDHAITVNRVVKANLGGVRGVLVVAPAGVESAFSIIAKDSRTGQYAARMSLTLQPANAPCFKGYEASAQQSTPYDLSVRKWNRDFACAEKRSRGAKSGSTTAASAATPGGGTVLGTYDVATRQLTIDDEAASIPQSADLGKESWKWMMLGPAVAR